ncbi:MAG TPA: O-antigen ligase family protein [Thermoleophilaceae bacterium]|nr:O-antigen ligase family protein [Thermoleophilaceae bacterium]
MEHPDTAQLAAICGALGSVLVLAARGRVLLLAGLAALALAEIGLAYSIGPGPLDKLSGAAGAGAAAAGVIAVGAAAALLAKRPALLPVAVLVAAPFRPPLSFDSDSALLVSVANDGRLGRLLPLYLVLAAASVALGWRALRGREPNPLPLAIALPGAAFLGFACVSLSWADDLEAGANLLLFFTLPFAALLATVARSAFPVSVPRALAAAALALAALFAAVGLWQAVTRELFFYAPNLAVSNANTDYFRVTSLFGDPSLYGRHLVLGIGVVLALLAARRWRAWPLVALLVLIWAGLFFSYSQSSFAALLAVTLGLALATGGRRVRVAVGVLALVAALAGAGYVAVQLIDGKRLNRITSDRTERVEDTLRVIREEPIRGVGIGGQPRASRRLARSERPTPAFVSHTTPLTVAAELGALGLVLYALLLAGGAWVIRQVHTRDEALGLALGAALLALFVHALFYSGFLEDPLTWLVLGVAAGSLGWARAHEAPLSAAERARARMAPA